MTIFDEVCNDFEIKDKDKKELSKLIKDKDCITEIDFWTSYYFNTIKEKNNQIKINILKGDITKIKADAIVNAANSSLLGGGGVDGVIHRAAGLELKAECEEIRKKYPKGLPTGEAVATKAYNLPAKIIIHTVGPRFYKDNIDLLEKCYLNSLKIAEENGCESISFPAISTGAYGVPIELSAKIVQKVLNEYNSNKIKQVNLVLFSDTDFKVYKDKLI